MTREEILRMPAGREMDVLVAKKIMGCKAVMNRHGFPFCECAEHQHSGYSEEDDAFPLLLCYSDEISAAWFVVERLTDSESLNDCELRTSIRGWRCDFGGEYVNAETAPLAICRAALLTTLEEQ